MDSKRQTCWLWVALCWRTRQIVACMLGDRSQESAFWLREAIPKAYTRRATRSDFREAYSITFTDRTHPACGKEEGETCHVERYFRTLRQRVGRLVGKALSFSKSAENHLDAIHLFIVAYNIQIKRSTFV